MMPSTAELASMFMRFATPAVSVERIDAAHPLNLGSASIAIGAFDGFHLGHRELVDAAIEDAERAGIRSMVVTFDPDPDCVVGPGPAPKLTSIEDRLALLAHSGVDAVVVVPFTDKLSHLDHEAFFHDVLGPSMDIRSIHVGSDFRLGYLGASDVHVMGAWCADRGIELVAHDLVRKGSEKISSTRIRAALSEGDVCAAADLLGRTYMVRGRIAKGRGQGHKMGFPTANIEVREGIQMPADGVYSGLALVDGNVYPAAINVGLPPMFRSSARSAHLEANLIGFSGDIYGSSVSLAFSRHLRPSRVFDSQEELVRTVMGNINDVCREFGECGVPLN